MPRPCCVVHGSTKSARHAASPGCQPALQFLAAQLHLFSFILSDDSVMLGHFLSHYHRLGVRPSHTHVAIRMRRSGGVGPLEATRAALRHANVPDANVRVLHTAPSDELKIRLINERIDAVPASSWFVYADVDELFDYPCELQGAVARSKACFAGAMWDQLASTGGVTTMLAGAPDVTEQYPLQCRIRATAVPHLQTTKVILHRVLSGTNKTATSGTRTYFRTTHAISGATPAATRCAVRGLVRHYTMTTRQLAGNAQKASAYRVPRGLRPSESRNYANATCGNVDARTGGCLDYAMLQRFMEERLASRAAGKRANANATSIDVSPLCPQTLARMAKGAPCSPTNKEMC